MDSDDVTRGYLLSRRRALSLLGGAGALLFAGREQALAPLARAATTCVVRPALTEGPYFVDELLNRSDIRTDPSDGSVRAGALLRLSFQLGALNSGQCLPLVGAWVDVWHCDHLGVYSDAVDPGFNTVGKKYLRGYQVSDTNGVVEFLTIYPGWYSSRAVHIHFKIRSAPGVSPGFEFTSQLFFDDELTDLVHAQSPYSAKGQRTLRNTGDGIYNQGGSQLVLDTQSTVEGYAAALDVALQNVTPVQKTGWGALKSRR